MPKFFKQTIRLQFLFVMLFLFFVAVIGVTTLLIVESEVRGNYINERERLTKEARIIENIEENYNNMVLRSRGYLSFESESELQKSREAYKELSASIEQFKQLDINAKEQQLIYQLEEYIDEYYNELLPQAVEYVNQGNEDALQDLASSSNGTASVNQLLNDTQQLVDENESALHQSNEAFLDDNYILNIYVIAFVVFMFILLTMVTRKMYRDIAYPLQELSATTERLADGAHLNLPNYNRVDEIGTLSVSFSEMAETIQERESELQAHNEELQAQQDELTEQQERLEDSYNEIKTLNTAISEAAIVAISDPQGKITFVNDKFCEITQYSENELIGSPHTLLQSRSLGQTIYDNMIERLRLGQIWKGEVQNQSKDGSKYWVDTTIVPYLDENGDVEKYISIQFDITLIKNAETDLKQMLEESNRTKARLQDYNEMNHALSITLDKGELMNTIVTQLTGILQFEKGLIIELHEYEYASIGVSEQDAERLVNHLDNSVMLRIKETGQSHVIKRSALPDEQGYLDDSLISYDLYAPVFNPEEDIIGVFVCTRIGSDYADDELKELEGILNQVSLALDKILLYEETENNRQLNQNIIDNVNEGIQFVDEEGRIVQYNEKLCEYLFIDMKDAHIDHSFEGWSSILNTRVRNDAELVRFFKEAIFTESGTGTMHRYEVEQPFKRIMEVYAETIYSNEYKLGTLFVHRDITEQYEVDQMKSELVSTVSHELRTPLASVLGYTELMLKRDLTPERRNRYISTIHKEANRLTNLINDFLDLQRMESGSQSYEFQQTDVIAIAHEVIEGFQVNHPHHEFELQSRLSHAWIAADREKLVQVYTNIIGNAVKFSPDGGKVIVSISNNQDHVVVHIADEGLGIPDNELTKLFRKFQRIDNSDRRKIGGTGLGLAICKEIIEAHNGKITIRSELGEGSVFTFMLPLGGQEDTGNDTITPVDSNLPFIMVVEDDESLATLLQDELQDAGFYVRSYSSGEAAFKRLEHYTPDAFVIDLMLGEGMNGWDIVEQLKNRDDTKSIPIFISTALDERQRGETLGVEHYLTKPYPPNKLATVILQTLLTNEKQGQILIADKSEL
ncbi:PAS domain-containing protein [Pontibacillus yanchengensis]|uniref:PAS domain-containing protein n=1 Tax=Pontibacillus yanchengensis TaxID=462910 RepID=A0ACC7VGF9_9BACI|nr:ATP-binding protein [Pontibacillus yanchengensis]MYL54053.1 PAS domain-containing protein [Pontibacillus yanchengensis]